jgi:HEAT repeat protein
MSLFFITSRSSAHYQGGVKIDKSKVKKMEAEGDITGLIKALKSKSKNVRLLAARALGNIGEPAVEPLVPVLQDKNRDVKEAACEAFGIIGEPAVIPLIQVLKNKDADVRWPAVLALTRIGEPAERPLQQALRYEDTYNGAATALNQIKTQKFFKKVEKQTPYLE